FGVAEANAGGGAVSVAVAGDAVPQTVSKLSAGGLSRVVAVNPYRRKDEDQCRLVRVTRPNGSEYVVGTCNEAGDVAIQPRASRTTSTEHVFNVCAYGAVPDGRFVPDGEILTGFSDELVSPTAGFTPADEGKTIAIAAAGANHHNLVTTIEKVLASNRVE